MSRELERFRGEVERQRENSARFATAYAEYESTGQGGIEFGKRANFGLTFIEKPVVSYGAVVDLDALSDLLDVDPKDMPPLPIVTGYVTEWDRDDRGFYIGAWCAARVFFDPLDAVAADVNVRCEHDFSFTAVAMKDIPLDQTD